MFEFITAQIGRGLMAVLCVVFIPAMAVTQVCLSLDSWDYIRDNGDGTCDYLISVTVDSGSNSPGTAEFSIGNEIVYTEPNCRCNPESISFTITVPCESTIEVVVNYDGPGNGNDCEGSTGEFLLPVVWYSGPDISLQDGALVLSFSVASQINNSHFIIEHSLTGENFKEIGRIEAEGTLDRIVGYEYRDDSPQLGINYYRIKQVDYDGAYSYSSIARMNISTGRPVYEYSGVTGNVHLMTESPVSVRLITPRGVILIKQHLAEGSHDLSLINLPSGVYYLRIGSLPAERIILY